MKISVVVNTFNEQENIERCLTSVTSLADEIVVVDMKSSDRTYELARQFTDKIFLYPQVGFVEPARNFAIEKTSGDWILILDADEIISPKLAAKLKEIIRIGEYDFIRLPRKNLIFGTWLKYSGWWPDYLIRFFKKGHVTWSEQIHGVPTTYGLGLDLEASEDNAITHFHYQTISQYLERLNRYTEEESKELVASGYKFSLKDLVTKPGNEFLARFFAWEGYKDGIHGFALAGLQTFSFFVTYLKVWEKEKYPEDKEILEKVGKEIKSKQPEFNFWFWQKRAQGASSWKKIIFKLAAKLKL